MVELQGVDSSSREWVVAHREWLLWGKFEDLGKFLDRGKFWGHQKSPEGVLSAVLKGVLGVDVLRNWPPGGKF